MKYAIVYDLPEKKQALFFGYDTGIPCVLENSAKIYDSHIEATKAMSIANKVASAFQDIQPPYIVEIPNG